MKSKEEQNEIADKRDSSLKHQVKKVIEKAENPLLLSLNTGFSNIDDQLNGLKLGELYILGGAAAMGQQTFIGQLAMEVAEHSGVLYLTQFESPSKLSKRLLSIAGNIQSHQLEQLPWNKETTDQVSEILNSFKSKKLFIEKEKQFEQNEFMKLIEDYVTQNGIKLIIINNENNLFRNLKVKLTTDEKYNFILKLKLLLRRLDCCGMILKKIKSAKRTQGNPFQLPQIPDIQLEYNLADLADHIWFMHRLEYYGIDRDGANNLTKNRIDLYVMDDDGGYLENLYFSFNERFTGMEVVERSEINY
ncbi:DnaB-like helicase C-terminal domain-containing protein [Brumimicrobium oceani]|uniref:SF4 helicase domain-containing protein n=1 Tax=Brumimicrobium oceani TaxID=2100725 RepID=A0A2U2XEQ7_9FLAO|nr:DnaB-like helicase C-terminal domain-containing protein [Brumimicrobium oceani]PWH86288.1 hypothetical protein DIT68_03350 [Brumimicrobium oceani]